MQDTLVSQKCYWEEKNKQNKTNLCTVIDIQNPGITSTSDEEGDSRYKYMEAPSGFAIQVQYAPSSDRILSALSDRKSMSTVSL